DLRGRGALDRGELQFRRGERGHLARRLRSGAARRLRVHHHRGGRPRRDHLGGHRLARGAHAPRRALRAPRRRARRARRGRAPLRGRRLPAGAPGARAALMSGPRWQYSAGEFVAVTKQRRAELAAALGEIRKNRAIHQQSRAEVEASYRTALSELVQTLVPSLDPQTLAWAAWATGFAPLGQPSFLAAMEDERQKLTAHVAALEAEPRYRDRELLRAPRVGTLTRQIEELEQYRAPLAEVVERCAHPRLEHLIEVGYGTPEYAVGFWRTAYYADWKAGDEILARFPERKTFAEVLRGYLEARDACVVYDAKIAELEAEVAEGERLESEHDKAKQALETISSRYVGHAREALGRHLSEIDLGAIGPRLAAAPQVEILAKRVAGLVAKAVYLDRLAHQHLDL